MKEIKQIIQAFEVAGEKGQKVALATVVHIEGSSYRAPGARMLVTEEGKLTGAISGGCLEGDALRKALMVMIEGKPLLATYDTSDEDDMLWGIGLGCNGIIRILIEPVDPQNPANPIALLKRAVQQRQPMVLVTFFSLMDRWNIGQGTRLLAREEALPLDDIADNALPLPFSAPYYRDSLLEDIHRVHSSRHSAFVNYGASEGITAFIEYVAPAISLIVAGAGNDVLPLVGMAKILGWEITLVDGRPGYANENRFVGCRIIVSNPEDALEHLVLDERTACVLMTHNYGYDKWLLKQLCHKSVRYIGMLGPKKKYKKMLQELEEEGIQLSREQQLRIYSPIGLDIGAETSEEIALSAVAEIKAVFAGKKAISLRDISGKIHNRDTAVEPGGMR